MPTLLGMDEMLIGRIEKFGLARYSNRELSWLDFAQRILDLVEDADTPTLEMAKFLAILSGGLDEFFQVRVAGLKDQLAASARLFSPDGLSPKQQLNAVRKRLEEVLVRQESLYSARLLTALSLNGIEITNWSDLSKVDKAYLEEFFFEHVYPVLTPLAVDPAHPFPYISNLSMNFAVIVSDLDGLDSKIARVKVPPLIPRFIAMPDGERYVLLEQVISAHLDSLFPEMSVGARSVFRVTRNADLTLEEEEADDLLVLVEMELRRRRFGKAVRLEIESDAQPEIVELLVRELDLHADDVYLVHIPLDLSGLWELHGLERPELKEVPAPSVTPVALADPIRAEVDIFSVLKEKDVLVHHPYESFSSSVEAFIEQAADDPDVLAIKQTLYRTSGDSAIVASLIKAAEAGKQVAVLIELKARFDEMANIAWARKLEQAGVHVVYGLVGLKTHMKAVLVVRKEADGLRRYAHLGTGNYNAKTAYTYEDFGLLSANQELGADLTEVFNFLTGYSRRTDYSKLILAPMTIRTRLSTLIDEQIARGSKGRIIIKVNGLVDPMLIDELYGASMAGVKVELMVRGICSLRPGVVGLSENITVVSIVGTFLEHSRVFCFGDPNPETATIYLGSADLMQRNLDRRIEALFPIDDLALKERVLEVLSLDWSDDSQSWILGSDGSWVRKDRLVGINAQETLARMATERNREVGRQS